MLPADLPQRGQNTVELRQMLRLIEHLGRQLPQRVLVTQQQLAGQLEDPLVLDAAPKSGQKRLAALVTACQLIALDEERTCSGWRVLMTFLFQRVTRELEAAVEGCFVHQLLCHIRDNLRIELHEL